MRVVVVHNYYDSRVPSGENAAVDDELMLLPQVGIDVVPFVTSSDELLASAGARVKAAAAPLHSFAWRRRLAELLDQSQPDIVHLHNIYPRPGPSIIGIVRARDVPIVQSVHNRRVACMVATQFRDGSPCADCAGRRVQWPGAKHGCYRGSRPQSTLMAVGAAVHYAGLRNLDHYFAVSQSIADVVIAEGVSPQRVSVKPNPVADLGVEPLPARRGILYAGRLEESKGAQLLLDAWLRLAPHRRPRLTVCGSGMLESHFEAVASREDDLDFLGRQAPAEVRRHVAGSTAVVVPSIAGEGLPRVIAESFSAGRPVLATDIEPIASVVGPRGWLFPPDASRLAAVLEEVASASNDAVLTRGRCARLYYELNFRPEAVLALQRSVYEAVISMRAS